MPVESSYNRYARQIRLNSIGEEGQKKLEKARVLVVGAGGLGCPVLLYLTAAGVGHIGIVDDDIISLSNLHRQILYREEDIGSYKVEKAVEHLKNLNSQIKYNSYNSRLTNKNALDIISNYDIIVDGTDNMVSRYIINDACVLLNKPFVYGAISKFEGQVAVFNFNNRKNSRSANYRDLFPVKPGSREVLNCEETGVLGVLPGIIGTIQAAEVIKLITKTGKPLINSIMNYNSLSNEIYTIDLEPGERMQVDIPSTLSEFQDTSYEELCSIPGNDEMEIDLIKLDELLTDPGVEIVDVRDRGELPEFNGIRHSKIPLDELNERISDLKGNQIILFCKTGVRSLQGARMLREILGEESRIFSLRENIIDIQNYFTSKVDE